MSKPYDSGHAEVPIEVVFHSPAYDFTTVFAFDPNEALRIAPILAAGPKVKEVIVSIDPAHAEAHVSLIPALAAAGEVTVGHDGSTGLTTVTLTPKAAQP